MAFWSEEVRATLRGGGSGSGLCARQSGSRGDHGVPRQKKSAGAGHHHHRVGPRRQHLVLAIPALLPRPRPATHRRAGAPMPMALSMPSVATVVCRRRCLRNSSETALSERGQQGPADLDLQRHCQLGSLQLSLRLRQWLAVGVPHLHPAI